MLYPLFRLIPLHLKVKAKSNWTLIMKLVHLILHLNIKQKCHPDAESRRHRHFC